VVYPPLFLVFAVRLETLSPPRRAGDRAFVVEQPSGDRSKTRPSLLRVPRSFAPPRAPHCAWPAAAPSPMRTLLWRRTSRLH